MMLAFDQDVAAQIQARIQQRAFGCKAAVRHEQNLRGWCDEKLDGIRLIVCRCRRKYPWWIKNLRDDRARQPETFACGQTVRRPATLLECTMQSLMDDRPVGRRIVDQAREREIPQ